MTAATHELADVDVAASVRRGIGWKLASQLVVQGLRFAVGIVLARLLTPAQFGVAGMTLVFLGLGGVFSDLALGVALVQRRTLREEHRSTVFWLTVAVGTVMTGAGIGLSGIVADFYGEPMVQPLFAVGSISFFLVSLSATQASLLTREMDFRSLELREMAAAVVGGTVAIAVAGLGFGPWALVAQQLALGIVAFVLLWRFSPWRPRLLFSTDALRDLGGFSLKVFTSRFFMYATQNGDNMLVGRYLGAAPLGAYALAYNTMMAPLARVARPVQQVMFPAMSRVQDGGARLGESWLRSTRLLTAVLAPGYLGMLIVAPEFVSVVFGSRWAAATPVLRLLCVAGLAQAFQSLTPSVLQARRAGSTLLALSAVSGVANLAAFASGLRWGIVGVAGLFAATRLLLLPLNVGICCRAAGVTGADFARQAAPPLAAAAVIAGAAGLVHVLVAGEPTVVRLTLTALTGVVAAIAVYHAFEPRLLDAFRRRRSAAPVTARWNAGGE